MNAKEVLQAAQSMSMMVLKGYFADLTDAELLTRPGVGCNHLAWQLGHLINSEVNLLKAVCPGTAIELPAGFAEAHGKNAAGENNAAKFCTKDEYVALFDKVNAATLTALEKLSEADLDQPAPEQVRAYAPTVGNVFVLIATHPMMHAGQFVPVRRALGKPVLF
jgi:hypothetical protein